MKAIEAGIYTESTKNRLIELENIQTKLENEILIEKKRLLIPKLTRDRISFFLKNLLLENNSKEELQKKILSDFVDAIIIEENSMLISYRFNGENNIVAADFNAIKNASEDVRKRSKWWTIRNDFRTFFAKYDTTSERLFVLCCEPKISCVCSKSA